MTKVDKKTGLIEEPQMKLNEVIFVHTRRPDGSLRIQTDYQNCPTRTDQHTSRESDVNYLMEKFQPDELAAFLATRNMHRQEITDHDFANEPTLQGAMNIALRLKKEFEMLPDDIKIHFNDHVDYIKFIDNPANQKKMLKLGLLTDKQVGTVNKLLQNNDDPNNDKNQKPNPPADKPLDKEAPKQ